VLVEQSSDQGGARPERDEDDEEAGEEEPAGDGDLTRDARLASADLLEADAAHRRQVAGHERQHARREE
jgi:hypothetical protein